MLKGFVNQPEMISELQLKDYLSELPEDRREPIQRLYRCLQENLPKGFESRINGKFLSFDVPLDRYPSGYHVTPDTPLPFISIASQKHFVALYHMGIYADKNILGWFQTEYPSYSKYKLDMGKSCIRFKHVNDIPYDLIAQLATKISVEDWIATYEEAIKR